MRELHYVNLVPFQHRSLQSTYTPEFYTQRLAGAIPNAGVLDHEECCVRPGV